MHGGGAPSAHLISAARAGQPTGRRMEIGPLQGGPLASIANGLESGRAPKSEGGSRQSMEGSAEGLHDRQRGT